MRRREAGEVAARPVVHSDMPYWSACPYRNFAERIIKNGGSKPSATQQADRWARTEKLTTMAWL
jgi:hypothetical protein